MEDRLPIRVRFLELHRAWSIGSDPVLQAAEAEGLIALGVCELFDKPESPVAVVDQDTPPAIEPVILEPEPSVVTEDVETNDNANDSKDDGGESASGDAPASEIAPVDRQRGLRRKTRPRS